MKTFAVRHSLHRIIDFFDVNDKEVPRELLEAVPEKPCTDDIMYALPSAKSAYTCCAKTEYALWMGSPEGLTRYAPSPEHEIDRVMFFCAPLSLKDNEVKAVYADNKGESVWVLTSGGVSHIVLKYISSEEKAEMLTEETHKYVDRRGMVTDRWLSSAGKPGSRVPYGSSDNSGCFTAAFAIGELFKYDVYRKKYGENHEKTVSAYKSAVRAAEACQLLMYLPSRGDGFVARDYQLPSEPLPEDSILFRKHGDKTEVLKTPLAVERGYYGKIIDSPVKVPERLAKLYKDEGSDGENLVYRGDTSSDEITIHLLLIYFAHKIIGKKDPELDEIMVNAMVSTVGHIVDNGYMLCDFAGKPTTWARWDKEYFSTPIGWSDGCLNAAELLMYLKMTMAVTGEKGKWLQHYNHLINDEGYAELTTMHEARFYISSSLNGIEETEDLMYGDNMLAAAAYWMLITLEDDKKLKEMYKEGLRGWNSTFRREHNPAYDMMYMLSCPEDDIIDTVRLEDWFRRNDTSRIMASHNIVNRHDLTLRRRTGGQIETGSLLPPDEFVASKYDRNPFEYIESLGERELKVIESAYSYTFAYWFGRYYNIIEEE